MNLQLLLAFVAASAVIGLIPGPGVTTIVGYALGRSRGVALMAVAGATAGNALAMSLSLAGAGAILAQSALAFSVLKWIGAVYLVCIGVLAIVKSRRALQPLDMAGAAAISASKAFWGTVLVTALNPKTILFFVAFVPQFMTPHAGYVLQAAVLLAVFCAVVGVTDAAYALLASGAASIVKTPQVRMWAERIGGGVLIGAGVGVAAIRR